MSEGNGTGQPSPLELKRWHRVFYRQTAVSFELKRLKRHEARPLQKMLTKVFAKMAEGAAEELTPAQRAEVLDEVYNLMPEEDLKRWFGECVQGVEGLRIDGHAVSTGAALLEESDDDIVLFILTNLFSLSKLQAQEGKESRSPSMSLPGPEGRNSSLDVASTDAGDGAKLLIAQEIHPEPPSSSVPAEA